MDILTLIAIGIGLIGLILYFVWQIEFVRAVVRNAPRDLRGAWRAVQFYLKIQRCQFFNISVPEYFRSIVQQHPLKTCLLFEDQRWTFQEVDEMSNRIGNYFQKQGLTKGERVGVLMENCPEFVIIWLGLAKIGVIAALINSNLRLKPLQHCLEAAGCKALIYGTEVQNAVEDIEIDLPTHVVDSFKLLDNEKLSSQTDLISQLKINNVSSRKPKISEKIGFNDCLFYIYTSGTTGLPKAAIIKHGRYMLAAMGAHYMNGIRMDDVLYTAMPLYHSAANIIGIGQALLFGIPVAFRRKFSATNYWEDCVRYEATVAQYIGEICRYLLSQPVHRRDNQHKVRVMIGVGLRGEIWKEFATRFNIQHIVELYGSTEGNCNLINFDGKVGAVGFIPRIILTFIPMILIKVDPVTGKPIRNPKTGICIRCGFNEPGELVGLINKKWPWTDFEGYSDHNSKEKKLVRNVKRNGDLAFRSGDILSMDENGYVYFKDRIGDTFRWKGENVSTIEVESIINKVTNLKDTIVYGVEIPNTDGRAGMVAILNNDNSLDLDLLAQEVNSQLPTYARPLFVRELKEVDLTGTFKYKKVDLKNEGFNIHSIQDAIYFYSNFKYIKLTNELYSNIINGKVKL